MRDHSIKVEPPLINMRGWVMKVKKLINKRWEIA